MQGLVLSGWFLEELFYFVCLKNSPVLHVPDWLTLLHFPKEQYNLILVMFNTLLKYGQKW